MFSQGKKGLWKEADTWIAFYKTMPPGGGFLLGIHPVEISD
jgi:hypothetical protein